MARPEKNNCDYFPHDAGMRNHRKIKAIRSKYGQQGYATWSMLLEYLTQADGNEFHNSDLELELIAGDFGVSVTELREVIDYCLLLELLFIKNGFIHSESLDEKLLPVYEKRKRSKDISAKQKRLNGKYVAGTIAANEITVTEMPQSKVNKIKVNKSKINNTNASPLVEIEIPFSEAFKKEWADWKNYKKTEHRFNYKSIQSEKSSLADLLTKSENNEEKAIAIIQQSIANGWKGFFELKNTNNGHAINNQQQKGFTGKQAATSNALDRVYHAATRLEPN